MISTQPVHCDHCEMCTSEICLTLLRFVHQLCHHNFALQITFAFGHIQPTIQREVLTRCSSKLWCEHWAGRWSWQTGSSPFCAYFYILILNSVVWWYSHVMTCLASFAFLIHVSIYSEVLLVTGSLFSWSICCVVLYVLQQTWSPRSAEEVVWQCWAEWCHQCHHNQMSADKCTHLLPP